MSPHWNGLMFPPPLPPCPPAGIYTQEQVEAWKPVVQAVHDKGAKFFMQVRSAG